MKNKLFMAQIFKYVFFLILFLQVTYIYTKPILILVGFVELALVLLASGYIVSRNKLLGYLINFILLLIIGIEIIVYRFAGNYVSLIMVTNLESIQGISGKTILYLLYIIPFIVALCIPTPKIEGRFYKSFSKCGLVCVLLFTEFVVWNSGGNASPIENSILLFRNIYARQERYNKIAQSGNSDFGMLDSMFYKDTIGNYISFPWQKQNPDVVLIFTEGLSQNIIDDERKIMPNVRMYEDRSLNFINYYNHTAATYRGLIGQLYSGHQYNNNDENTLISLQKIMHDNGYQTTLINTEPNNQDFTNYLKTFDFDRIVTSNNTDTWLRDDEAYELLGNEVKECYENSKPDFIVIYTFGTHATFDESNVKYGDGKNGLLNRFANADYYFGEFMRNFENNEKYNDLVVVFTTDHCTYEDEDFIRTFEPSYTREDYFCDQIPLMIWNNKIEAQEINAEGRNSLCFAPTLLDFLDIDGDNYFLGDSLFSDNDVNNLIDKVYAIPDEERYRITSEDGISELDEDKFNIVNPIIKSYLSYTIKAKEIVY